MTLTIHKLNTHCRAAKTFAAGTLVDDASRNLLVSELSAQLVPSLDRLPAVVERVVAAFLDGRAPFVALDQVGAADGRSHDRSL